MRRTLTEVAAAPDRLAALSAACRDRVHRHYTWRAKAAQMVEVYRWVLKRRPDKPSFFDKSFSSVETEPIGSGLQRAEVLP
jgi:hypothetical protein